MADFRENEYWVYRKKDQSLVGVLEVTELEDVFDDIRFLVCSGKLTHRGRTDEVEQHFRGWYELKHPGKTEHFGDFDTREEVCEAVKNHPDGECFLVTVPILPFVD
ncbi:hypothetical protein [Lewinella sp. 4G2]|uniref:hypothetical protein n=1 Tax=Lewinella sp. 4G2 TaxID=1803372 RepID=UPI0007B4A802|nr:hypothetical protein [Lewinella sp. 4G2]OAV44584.1 hypothetical protein A3850_008805 [Lewinella sp. 4G2]